MNEEKEAKQYEIMKKECDCKDVEARTHIGSKETKRRRITPARKRFKKQKEDNLCELKIIRRETKWHVARNASRDTNSDGKDDDTGNRVAYITAKKTTKE